jgi:acetolactate synthase-1/2/3 large subunit
MTGAQAVARALVNMGIEYVAGIPGGYTGAIYDALYDYQDRLRVLLVREESLGTVMAEAYGRLTGKPMVVMGQGAWVLTNAGAGMIEAHAGSSPMIILADLSENGDFSHHGSYQAGSGDYGTFDAQRGYEAITKRTFVARSPVQAVQMVQLAVKHALTGEPGPVAVLFSMQSLNGRLSPDSGPPVHLDRSYLARPGLLPADDLLDAAAGAIRAASRPVIIAGSGVRLGQAQEALRRTAEALDIPVATSAAGKGVFPEDHPLSAGVMGPFGNSWANRIVAEADVVLAVGTKLGASDTANENRKLLDVGRQRLIHVDIDPLNTSWTLPAEFALVGDAAETLNALRQRIGEQSTGAEDRVAKARAQFGFDTPAPRNNEGPIRARHAVDVLSDALPQDAIVTCDAGENRLFMLGGFRATGSRGFLQPNATGGMGYAIPAALGAKLAYPDLPVFAVCGDGGFAMTMHGLMTAIELELPIVNVVLDNQVLGWVYHGQGNRQIASEFADFDLAAIARAIGCEAYHVSDEAGLREVIPQALATGRPAVINVRTALDDTFRDVLSTLSGPDPEDVTAGQR